MDIPEAEVQKLLKSKASTSERISFESLISDLSARFINVPPGKVDEEIEQALAQVREFFQMDRWGLIEVVPAETGAYLTHASQSEGIPQASKTADLRKLFPWAYGEIVERGKCLVCHRLEDVPDEAEEDRKSFSAWGVKSSLHIPLSHGGRVAYIFACNSMREERVWPEEFLPRLRLLGEIFVNALVRTRSEEALRLSEARYRSLVETQSEIIARSDLSGRLTFVNDAYCRAFGRSREDLLGEVFTPTVLPEDLPISLGALAEIQIPPYRRRTETRHLTPEGVRWISWDNSAVLNEHGSVVEFQGVGRDITERKDAESKLRASEEKFRQFFKTSPDYCYIVSPEGMILDVNDSAIQTLGYDKGELIGRPLELIYAPESQQKRARQFENWKEAGQILNEEMVIVTRSGEKRTVLLNAGAVRDEDGTLLHTASIQTDITSRKQMESQLKARFREIEDLKQQLEAENIYLREETRALASHGRLVGNSPALRAVMTQVQQVAPTDSTVLLLGETGTGKGLVAQFIHDLSPRKARIMVKVDCASLPASLIESELFGRAQGAYTGALTSQIGRFESANGSTIFLDEIAELSLELQSKLLRVVQEGEFERLGSSKTIRTDVRVIAATNRDLLKEMQEGRFREDLYYRLSVFPIRVPALRERIEDIPLLVQAFVSEFSAKMPKNIRRIPKQVIEALQLHPWPGNVRELRNVIERAFIISDGDLLNVTIPRGRPESASATATLHEADAGHILRTLESCQWRIKGPQGAARLLGLKPSTLYSKMNKLGIPTRRAKDEMRT